MPNQFEYQAVEREPACLLDSKTPKRLFIALVTVILLGLVVLCFGDVQEGPRKTSAQALAGLRAVDLSEIGPWQVGSDGHYERAGSELDVNALSSASKTIMAAGVSTRSGDISVPKLRLVVDYGSRSSNPVRGRRQLRTAKLILEDEVKLDRTPPLISHLASWSSERTGSFGSGADETEEQLALLLNDFIGDIEQSRTHR